jgi:hypothetical protein
METDLTLSGNRFDGKRKDGSAVSAVKLSGRPDCRGSNGRNSDCDLIGRFNRQNERTLEFTTRDGVNYLGKLIHVKPGSFWWKHGYRPGMILYKLKRIEPNDMGGSEYTGHRLRSPNSNDWKEQYLVRTTCRGVGFWDRETIISFWERVR